MVLEYTLIIVEQGELGPGLFVEDIVGSGVLQIVNHRCKQDGEELQAAQPVLNLGGVRW